MQDIVGLLPQKTISKLCNNTKSHLALLSSEIKMFSAKIFKYHHTGFANHTVANESRT